jgi:hypothetical protein
MTPSNSKNSSGGREGHEGSNGSVGPRGTGVQKGCLDALSRFTVTAGVFGALVLLALAWAAPLAARLATAIPGTPADLDVVTMVWNVWWVQQALETNAPLLRSDRILVPFGADLRLHTYGTLPAAIVWPIAHWSGVVVAFNVMVLATVVLNGWMGYLLFRSLPTRPPAAFMAAAALMLSGPVLDQIRVGRPIFASIWITCTALILARRLVAHPTVGSAAALGAALVAALFTDFQMLLFTLLWIAMLGAWAVCRERGLDWARAGAGLLALAVLAAPFGLIFFPALAGAAAAGIPAPSLTEADNYSFRWWDYLTPSVMPRALGGFELIAALAVSPFVARRDPRVRFWLLGGGLLLLLALGPTLKFTGIPLPFSLLTTWPPMQHFRTPYRLTIPAVIGAAAVAALLLDRLLARLSSRHARLLAAAAVTLRVALATFQHPLATQEYRAYDVYRRIAGEPSLASVIEVPFGIRSGLDRIGTGGESLQYYQPVHGRPIVNAMVARLPSTIFEYYRRHPSLVFLAGEPNEASDDTIAADFDSVLTVMDAGYVLVHRERMSLEASARAERLFDAHPRLERWTADGDLIVYRVVPPRAR